MSNFGVHSRSGGVGVFLPYAGLTQKSYLKIGDLLLFLD